MKTTHAALAVFVLPLLALAQTGPITESFADFSTGTGGWTYYGGWEFPGASGTLTRAEAAGPNGTACARLSGNFTKGGSYVAMNRNLKADLLDLRITARSDTCRVLSLRLTDRTGQTFQHTLPMKPGGDWQTLVLTNFAAAAGCWGGAADKRWHLPARTLSIMNGRPEGPAKTSDLYVASVTAQVQPPEPTALDPLGPSTQPAPRAAPLPLHVTADLPDAVFDDKRWEYSQRDAGTADTRPKLEVARGAFNGQDALVMNVEHPNASIEFVDHHLPKTEACSVWVHAGFEYLAFWCKSDATEGTMSLQLNRGNWRWQNGQRSWGVDFEVKTGSWHKVILPFSAFADLTQAELSTLNTVSLGYRGNRLRRPGKVMFAGFEAGAFAIAPAMMAIDLAARPWRFKTDDKEQEGVGLDAGWQKPGFDDSRWETMKVGEPWDKQGLTYLGIAWFRQSVMIPAAWTGCPLVLDVGKPDDRGTLFFNGDVVADIAAFGPSFHVVLPPDRIKYGQFNTLAVRISNRYRSGGLIPGQYRIGPQLCRIDMRTADGRDVAPEAFDMGCKPAASTTLAIKLPRAVADHDDLQIDYRLESCFHRTIKEGTLPLGAGTDKALVGLITLDAAQTRDLYYSEGFSADLRLTSRSAGPVAAFVQRDLALPYDQRDRSILPSLPETWDETPYGRLHLIDAVEAGTDDLRDEHPYKEGGIRDSWVGLRAYSTWVQGVTTNTYKGTVYREANNNEWFGYRIGRGKLTPHRAYLVRIEYPEDKTRYCPLNQDAGRNYSGKGFKTGVSPDDPLDPYPLSGNYEWYDQLIMLDELGYGYKGSRTAPGENGLWLFFHDNGRCYTSQYQAGPAVSRIRLYELPDIAAAYPSIRYPDGARHRALIMDWEREPEAPPLDVARYARFLGFNVIAPEVLKWSFTAYWPTKLGYQQQDPLVPFQPLPADRQMNTYEEFLKAAKAANIGILPRLEYGGSKTLPKEAYAKNPDGSNAKVGRYASWGANLLHPATWEEFAALLDETVGAYREQYPQVLGVLWRMRCDRMVMSQGPADIAMYRQETGTSDLAGYEAWWHKKRLEFHVKVRDRLRSYRPDMKLVYYNWDPDGWSLGDMVNTPQDWTDYYDVHRAQFRYQKFKAAHTAREPSGYLDLLKGMTGHKRAMMELYRNVDGIAFLAPVHWHYLADNAPYLDYFQTGDGLAMCNMFNYEEKGRHNVQGDKYESSEMTPGGPAFAMAEEVLACFHGDPNVVTCTTYTYGRGFVDAHRRFAQAFLALPDARGTVVDQGDADVRVRTYAAKHGVYVGIVHKGMAPKLLTIRLPGDWKPGTTVTDLVTGRPLTATLQPGSLTLQLPAGPMELHSYLVKQDP